ncbi:hypothetical protein L6452_05514 [Arctium lappa]|uniref:Uncharacterized protein n=1 Tax=Arctium lappa TaxID=4217 RepID=A0ACB9EHA1_ARCLA|nr:hypothetical protein L6452_05514 [Arctium lappa]
MASYTVTPSSSPMASYTVTTSSSPVIFSFLPPLKSPPRLYPLSPPYFPPKKNKDSVEGITNIISRDQWEENTCSSFRRMQLIPRSSLTSSLVTADGRVDI